ncbi:transcription initiation factor TFIID subunit 4-like isoform X2 [Mugil cephalus]|uniref:transcription initiation factor TFIID subunit 4-like isoform X2 n=1 Tax=Mugil cephalus TaxID=48193 RepID=UPI001FB6F761|nr:transcription initiation factor TFIID subunit 4-like isoform X2 [Mugil cephalus]
MATNKVVIEAQKLEPRGPLGDGDASVQVRILQVPAKCGPIKVIQPPPPAASGPKGDSVSAPSKVTSCGQGHQPTSSSSVTVSVPHSSPSSVVVVAKAVTPGGVSAGSQQVAKQALSQMASKKQVTTTGSAMVITVPRSAASQAVAPQRPQTASPQLPGNIHIPPGMMLIRSDGGQLMLVSQQALAQAQQGSRLVRGQAPRILAPQISAAAGSKNNEKVTVIRLAAPSSFQPASAQKTMVIGAPPKSAVVQSVSEHGSHRHIQAPVTETKKGPTASFSQETLESVKKCKNFLVTLIKLASGDSRSATMANNVRGLVRSLLEGKLEAEEFTEQLYNELKSTPQPCLVPFLKKSLPAVRCLTADPQLFVQQASTSSCNATGLSSTMKQSNTDTGQNLNTSQQGVQQVREVTLRPGLTTLAQSRNYITKRNGPTPRFAGVQPGKHFSGAFLVKQPFTRDLSHPTKFAFKDNSGSYKEDDDINDVASMAGVNLREENAQILTSVVGSVVQSCQDQLFLSPPPMLSRILRTGQPLGITDVGPEVVALVSHATQECLRGILEKLTVMAEHRRGALKEDECHGKMSDVRSQLRFLEEVESLKKKRKDEEERERLLRLARSRSHAEDPQHQQLKQRAKELQQIEEAQLQQREANLAALAAIGPRRKRPLDQTESQVSLLPRPGVQRVTRVMLKDLLVCMEQEHFLRHSLTLYKAML